MVDRNKRAPRTPMPGRFTSPPVDFNLTEMNLRDVQHQRPSTSPSPSRGRQMAHQPFGQQPSEQRQHSQRQEPPERQLPDRRDDDIEPGYLRRQRFDGYVPSTRIRDSGDVRNLDRKFGGSANVRNLHNVPSERRESQLNLPAGTRTGDNYLNPQSPRRTLSPAHHHTATLTTTQGPGIQEAQNGGGGVGLLAEQDRRGQPAPSASFAPRRDPPSNPGQIAKIHKIHIGIQIQYGTIHTADLHHHRHRLRRYHCRRRSLHHNSQMPLSHRNQKSRDCWRPTIQALAIRANSVC